MIKNKNILITGASGFIGSHLSERLIGNGNFLILIDNFNEYYTGKEKNLLDLTQKYENRKDFILIKKDLRNDSTLQEIEHDIDIIFHLAAQAGVRYSIIHPIEVMDNNIKSTVKLFEFCLNKNIKQIVNASSSSVYGNPEYTPVDEKHPKNPISPYAVSKLCCEKYAEFYHRLYGLPITSLRFFTVYGARQRPDMAIRKFFDFILNNHRITIFGDGEQLRDFTYISDIINGVIAAGEKPEAVGEVFNLGCSSPITVNQLVEQMYSIANKQKKIQFIEKQLGDVDITYSNVEKAKKILEYSPKIKVSEGLKHHYQWQISFNATFRS